jgi:Mevalonate pyrophosphate decarboxylase
MKAKSVKSQGIFLSYILTYRIGSGSASRSIYGGGVEWYGIQPELFGKEMLPKEEREKLSKQCIAKQVFGYEKFKDIDIIILVAKSEKKDVPSTSGMATSVQTSELIKVFFL